MRINELRLNGFKSFANKTSIKFDDNFIGIVGPNGSGKSNIIDAIRWVFGEQSSKSLRGKSSTDVIFGGTQNRKQANFAEITLVLDNTDQHVDLEYNEISVTRRLYRSGDSEYLINNVECRMKDIVDLFMDSGIGKNSFSIISQGKIEEIIVSKPEARRQVIEDISGVLKYKKRKEAALRKLERTNDNLKQVDIILNEMDGRLGPLAKQSEKAKEYQTLKEKLEQYEVSYLANRIYDIKDDYQAYKKINDDLNQKIITLNNEISISDASLIEIQDQERRIKESVNEANIQMNQVQEKIYGLQSNLKMINERQKILNNSDVSQTINTLKTTIINNQEQVQKINTDLNTNQHELNTIENELSQINQNLISTRNDKYDMQSQLNDIKEANKRNQYPFSIKQLINSNKFKNMHILKELFEVETKYAEAINVCIGGRLNDIIMNNMDDVKLAIKYLRDNQYGRATFVSLPDVSVRALEQNIINQAQSMNGFVGVASDLITTNNQYQDLFKSILSTTLVFVDIDSAQKCFEKTNKRCRIVSLQGDVFANNGTISGGKFKQVNPLLINQQIKELEVNIEKAESKIETYNKDLKQKEEQAHQLRLKVNYLEEQVRSLEEQIQVSKYELQDLDVEVDTETSGIDEELETLRNQYMKLHNQKIEYETQLDNCNEERSDIITKNKNDNEEIKILTKDLNENNVKLSRLEVELSQLMDTLSEEYQLSYERAYELSDKNINIEAYKQEVVDAKRRIKSLGVINPDAIQEYEEIKERYDFMSSQKEDSLIAMEKLTNIMDKLDTVVIEQFDEAYKKLRTEFKYIFSELFGGGQADLVLTDPSDLLTTGVEIVAQPPGKKLQTISLLSGGEKALTAISLLFAILRIKKVPFTILDEVEAALDEVNVKRYANYIKVFSERTQFLVITHRQGTMEACDSLYGITMVEKGISSVFKTSLSEGVNLTD